MGYQNDNWVVIQLKVIHNWNIQASNAWCIGGCWFNVACMLNCWNIWCTWYWICITLRCIQCHYCGCLSCWQAIMYLGIGIMVWPTIVITIEALMEVTLCIFYEQCEITYASIFDSYPWELLIVAYVPSPLLCFVARTMFYLACVVCISCDNVAKSHRGCCLSGIIINHGFYIINLLKIQP